MPYIYSGQLAQNDNTYSFNLIPTFASSQIAVVDRAEVPTATIIERRRIGIFYVPVKNYPCAGIQKNDVKLNTQVSLFVLCELIFSKLYQTGVTRQWSLPPQKKYPPTANRY
jgi:hypothetical protein